MGFIPLILFRTFTWILEGKRLRGRSAQGQDAWWTLDILPPISPGPLAGLGRPGSHSSYNQQGAADARAVMHRKGHAPAHLVLLREGAADYEENLVSDCVSW